MDAPTFFTRLGEMKVQAEVNSRRARDEATTARWRIVADFIDRALTAKVSHKLLELDKGGP